MNLYKEEKERFNESANRIYKDKFALDMTLLSLIRLYTLIEKRGFYIVLRGEAVTCPNELAFVLQIETKQKLGS
jgi:hypothetical protein